MGLLTANLTNTVQTVINNPCEISALQVLNTGNETTLVIMNADQAMANNVNIANASTWPKHTEQIPINANMTAYLSWYKPGSMYFSSGVSMASVVGINGNSASSANLIVNGQVV
jgi:hypothetical protein